MDLLAMSQFKIKLMELECDRNKNVKYEDETDEND
jgi:hypothetical protein